LKFPKHNESTVLVILAFPVILVDPFLQQGLVDLLDLEYPGYLELLHFLGVPCHLKTLLDQPIYNIVKL